MAPSRRQRLALHGTLLALAGGAVALGVELRTDVHSASSLGTTMPSFSLSGMTGAGRVESTYFKPGSSLRTAPSAASSAPTTQHNASEPVRAAGSVSTSATFTAGVAAAAVPGSESGVQPLADIVDPRQPFVLYAIQAGDSASLIADRFGIQLRTLLDNNPHLGDGQLVALGQELIVPRRDGILYKVGQGDTIESIVRQFDNASVSSLVDYRPNRVSNDEDLAQRSYVLLPGATVKPPPPPVSAPPPADGGGPRSPSGGRFSMPLAWSNGVTDAFGVPRGSGTYHTGIDLGLYGADGIAIVSACEGVVTRTEWLTYSYGYHVIVDCGDGWTTLYAHLSRIDAVVGQQVGQGTQLGLSGSTGFSTGEHLHFEIRKDGGFLNPADFLPF